MNCFAVNEFVPEASVIPLAAAVLDELVQSPPTLALAQQAFIFDRVHEHGR
jgi:hypothetical protein